MVSALVAIPSGIGFPIVLAPSGDTTGATDFANIQAALNIMGASTTAANHSLLLLGGEFYINQKLIFTLYASNLVPYYIVGYGVRLNQVTANTGWIEMQVPQNGDPIGPRFEGIVFSSANIPTVASTAAVCIGARSVISNGTGTETLLNVVVKNCKGFNCYTVIGNTQPSGVFSFWNLNFEQIDVNNYSGPVFNLASPTTVGNPNISIKHITTAQPTSDNVSPIVYVSGCDNLLLDNIEWLEHANGQPFVLMNSVSSFIVQATKAEASVWNPASSGTPYMFQFQNSYGVVEDFCLNGATINSGSGVNPVMFGVLAGAFNDSVVCNSVSIVNPSGNGTLALFQNTGGSTGMSLNMPTGPNLINLGSMTFRLTNSATVSSRQLYFSRNPGGKFPLADQGDASFTLTTPLTLPENLIWNTALTAARTVALAATLGTAVGDNMWQGAKVKVIRTAAATGGSLTVTGLSSTLGSGSASVAAGSWIQLEWTYDFGWVETGSGTLL